MPNYFKIEEFQNDVLSTVQEISQAISTGEMTELHSTQSEKQKAEKQKAEDELRENKDLKRIICPVLIDVMDDASFIANAITPLLVEAVLLGTLLIPLNPIFFGWLAVVIAKGGTKAICADYIS